jgi:hypothetical protein
MRYLFRYITGRGVVFAKKQFSPTVSFSASAREFIKLETGKAYDVATFYVVKGRSGSLMGYPTASQLNIMKFTSRGKRSRTISRIYFRASVSSKVCR